MQLNVNALGVPVVRRDLLRMGDRAIDTRPAMETILEGLYESNTKQFDSQGSHGSGGWTAPSDEWQARKVTLGLDSRTEQATLDLRKSLTQPGGDNIAIIQRDGIAFGTTVPYADEARKRGNVLVQPTEAERRAWVKVLQSFVITGDRAASRPLIAA